MGDPVREADRSDHRGKQGCQRRLGEVAEQQRGQRDAQLRAGKLERQRVHGAKYPCGAVGAVRRGLFELATVDRHQRELGGHEQPVADDENNDYQ